MRCVLTRLAGVAAGLLLTATAHAQQPAPQPGTYAYKPYANKPYVYNPYTYTPPAYTPPAYNAGAVSPLAMQVRTTVIVPDGGEAFVAGYSSFSEGRNEFGVPGLACCRTPGVGSVTSATAGPSPAPPSRSGCGSSVSRKRKNARRGRGDKEQFPDPGSDAGCGRRIHGILQGGFCSRSRETSDAPAEVSRLRLQNHHHTQLPFALIFQEMMCLRRLI
jgi:hypothetical protein